MHYLCGRNADRTSLRRVTGRTDSFLTLVRLERGHGKTHHHIAQFLTGYGGCYSQYLQRFGLEDSLNYNVSLPKVRHGEEESTPVLGRSVSPENIVTELSWSTQKESLKNERGGKHKEVKAREPEGGPRSNN